MTTIEEPSPLEATAAAPPGAVPATARPRRLRWLLFTLRAVTTVHVIAIFAQPVFAGSYLIGDYDMLARHATGADVVTTLGALQLIIAIVQWILGGPRWPTVATALLVVAETGQYFAGLASALELHVPLGVAILAGAVLICVSLWRPQDRDVTRGSR